MHYCQENGKIGYETRGAAQASLRHHRKRSRQNRNAQIYSCPFCRRYHIGRDPETIKHRSI